MDSEPARGYGARLTRGDDRASGNSRARRPQPAANPRVNDLDLEMWVGFLEAEILSYPTSPLEPILAAGKPITDTQRRAIARWTREGIRPSWDSAEDFLDQIGRHMWELEVYASKNGFECMFARGENPSWYARLQFEPSQIGVGRS